MTTSLTIRIPSTLAQVLEERKQEADLNISSFCRRAIERELRRPIVEADLERHIHGAQPILVALPKAGE